MSSNQRQKKKLRKTNPKEWLKERGKMQYAVQTANKNRLSRIRDQQVEDVGTILDLQEMNAKMQLDLNQKYQDLETARAEKAATLPDDIDQLNQKTSYETWEKKARPLEVKIQELKQQANDLTNMYNTVLRRMAETRQQWIEAMDAEHDKRRNVDSKLTEYETERDAGYIVMRGTHLPKMAKTKAHELGMEQQKRQKWLLTGNRYQAHIKNDVDIKKLKETVINTLTSRFLMAPDAITLQPPDENAEIKYEGDVYAFEIQPSDTLYTYIKEDDKTNASGNTKTQTVAFSLDENNNIRVFHIGVGG
ncbi:hypothetical protein SPB21_32545 [Leptothoe sp. ISB3NOV94-8A]